MAVAFHTQTEPGSPIGTFVRSASQRAFFGHSFGEDTIIQLSFNEMISGGEGFSFDYAAIAPTPLPQHSIFAIIRNHGQIKGDI
jgi:hypothetical protein